MKKLIFIFIVLFGIQSASRAQEFYFGLKTGLLKETYTLTEDYGNLKLYMEALFPTVLFNFKTIFNNRLEAGTGVGFYNYGCHIGLLTPTLPYSSHDARNAIYRSITVPFTLGYSFPIVAGLFANVTSGIDFDFYFDLRGYISDPYIDPHLDEDVSSIDARHVYPYLRTYLDGNCARFNVLLSNQIALEYKTKKNFCFSLFAAYHAGLREVWHGLAVIHYNEEETLNVQLFSRGSYWHFGIELGYR
ncbi:MAG: hypothetical protein LBV02_02645, partial [Bacteroidales bacterium]|nr:hypothetical protein [Bacteroidales bacterium]